MRTKTEVRRIRFPAPRAVSRVADAAFELEEEDVQSSDYIVMTQERDLPALKEHLRECTSRIFH